MAFECFCFKRLLLFCFLEFFLCVYSSLFLSFFLAFFLLLFIYPFSYLILFTFSPFSFYLSSLFYTFFSILSFFFLFSSSFFLYFSLSKHFFPLFYFLPLRFDILPAPHLSNRIIISWLYGPLLCVSISLSVPRKTLRPLQYLCLFLFLLSHVSDPD